MYACNREIILQNSLLRKPFCNHAKVVNTSRREKITAIQSFIMKYLFSKNLFIQFHIKFYNE